MNIAAVSDDGVTISQHFGPVRFYVVGTVENGQIAGYETRDKMGHIQFASQPHEDVADAHGHGFGAAAQDRHARMATATADGQVLLVRGMGAGAYQSMAQAGVRPVVTDIPAIDEAVQAYVEGRLVDHVERLY